MPGGSAVSEAEPNRTGLGFLASRTYYVSRSGASARTTIASRGDLALIAATLNNLLKGGRPGAFMLGLRHFSMKHNGRPGGQTALVVDDQGTFREAAERALSGSGFQVLLGHDGFQGIGLLIRHERRISILVVDTEMPGLHGWEVIRFARTRLPTIPVLRLGQPDDLVPGREYRCFQALPVLSKPFGRDAIVAQVRAVLRA